jgi:hypothetical protein
MKSKFRIKFFPDHSYSMSHPLNSILFNRQFSCHFKQIVLKLVSKPCNLGKIP